MKKKKKHDLKNCLNLVPGNNHSIVKIGLVMRSSRPEDMDNKYKSNIKAKSFLTLTEFNFSLRCLI